MGILRVNVLVTRRREPACGHLRSVLGAASRDVQQAGGRRAGRQGRGDVARPGPVLWKLEELQRQQIQKALEPKEEEVHTERGGTSGSAGAAARSAVAWTASSTTSSGAAWWAKRPTNCVSYLAVVSRLLESPLAILVQSSSAAGKSRRSWKRCWRCCPKSSGCSTRP